MYFNLRGISGRFGVFFVFLFICSSSVYAFDVGETVNLLVPDNSYYPDELQSRQFTCRAVTEHAYFLVQDTTFFDFTALEDFNGGICGNSGEEYWDLTNSDGRLVTTGLYVYCVQTSDEHSISKFAIIR